MSNDVSETEDLLSSKAEKIELRRSWKRGHSNSLLFYKPCRTVNASGFVGRAFAAKLQNTARKKRNGLVIYIKAVLV